MIFPGIIIARGGSKRVPRKNVKDFCGRPLVEWTIIQAKAAQGLDPVVLITDDDKIAKIGRDHDIMVFMRPTTADNVAGSVPFNMAIDRLQYMGYKFDGFVSLLPTNPLRMPGDIDKGIILFCTRFRQIGPLRVITIAPITSLLFALINDNTNKSLHYRDSEDTYADTGIYSVHSVKLYQATTQPWDHKQVLKYRRMIRAKVPTVVYKCKVWQGADIDTPDDFELCELVFRHYILDKGYYK